VHSVTARILARAAGLKRVEVGDVVTAKVDKVMIHDVTGPIAVDLIEELGVSKLAGSVTTYVILDHYSPPPTIKAANIHRKLREFSRKYGVKLIDVGEGICHQVLVEGLVKPGEVIVGADSHTVTAGALAAFATGVGSSEAAYAMITGELWFKVPELITVNVTGAKPSHVYGKDVALKVVSILGQDGANYKSLEFTGDGLRELSMDDRLTVANMSVECGAKNAVFPLDSTCVEYLRSLNIGVNEEDVKLLTPTYDHRMEGDTIELRLNELEPLVATPPSPASARPASELSNVEVNVAFIGSCTGGRYRDLLVAAKILRGRKVKPGVRLVAIPASRRIMLKALRTGVISTLVEAGVLVGPPSCGPCFGGHLGVAGDGEVVVTASNRNFVGRMGSRNAKIYLASPATVAASAITGKITDPREFLNGSRG